MARRAATEHCFVVGIDKPFGSSSHDVVNACRSIYGERRIGHTGTLDPYATGVLPICVGPATRLDAFLVGHDKAYDFSVIFGQQSETDDLEGAITRVPAPDEVWNESYACALLKRFEGAFTQIPPVYSAVKRGGRKACDLAREGKLIELDPRPVEVYSLVLLDIEESDCGNPTWVLRAHVSSGTYVRSLARDLGLAAKTRACVGRLRRVAVGKLSLEDCVSLDTLGKHPFDFLLDPVRLLGFRCAFPTGEAARMLANGAPLPSDGVELFSYCSDQVSPEASCIGDIFPANQPPADGEMISMVVENRLAAVYSYSQAKGAYVSACGFSKGVKRGGNI